VKSFYQAKYDKCKHRNFAESIVRGIKCVLLVCGNKEHQHYL